MFSMRDIRLDRFVVTLLFVAVVALSFSAQSASAQDSSDNDDTVSTTPVDGRQPIVENQFSTTTNGSLQLRRPGLYIQQGIAVQQGEGSSYFTGVPEEDPTWVRQTVDDVALNFIDMFTNMFAGLQYLVEQWSSSSGSSSTFVPITNAVTTGQGTTTVID